MARVHTLLERTWLPVVSKIWSTPAAQVRTLVEAADWEGLEGLAREMRAPIGGAPLAQAARAAGAPQPVLARYGLQDAVANVEVINIAYTLST